MPTGVIEELGKALVEQVRDRAIAACRTRLEPNAKGRKSQSWHRILAGADCGGALERVLPDIVDETIFCLLDAIDHGSVRLASWEPGSEPVDLTALGLGELAGWYIGGDWPQRYSAEPFVNPFEQG